MLYYTIASRYLLAQSQMTITNQLSDLLWGKGPTVSMSILVNGSVITGSDTRGAFWFVHFWHYYQGRWVRPKPDHY